MCPVRFLIQGQPSYASDGDLPEVKITDIENQDHWFSEGVKIALWYNKCGGSPQKIVRVGSNSWDALLLINER